VYVTQSSGRPGGAGLDIQIRGLKSLTASNKPLYVIDGLPLAPGAEDIMGEINPNDIESIDILKDAASSAIYGARGANGVVLVTTKRGTAATEGQQKKSKITYDMYTGMTEIAQKLDLFSGPEWLAMKKEAYRADGLDTSLSAVLDPVQLDVYNKGEWVDWQDELFKKGSQTSHNVSVSGGTEKLRALFSLGRYDEEGIFKKSEFGRNSGRLNVDYMPTEKFKIGANVALSSTESSVAGGDSTIKNQGQATAAGLSVLQTPAARLYDSNGQLQLYVNSEKAFGNPLYLIQESSDDNFRTRIISGMYGSYEFLPGLTYKLSGGVEYQGFKYGRFQTRYYNDPDGNGNNFAVLGYGEGLNYSIDNILSYMKEINDANNLDLTLLYGIQGNSLDTMASSSKNIPTDILGYDAVSEGTEPQPIKRASDQWRLESYMGRARYTLMDKYLLTLSARVDGSSKFGENNKYGFFPSAAVAWKIEREPFMANVTAIDLLKLRLSYGTIGNQDIPSFRSLSQAVTTRYSYGGTVVAGSNIGTFGNPDLKWETTQQFNAGVDYSILNSLFDGSIEIYSAKTKDLLLAKAISSANGDTAMYDNIGQTKSSGIEANIIARIIKNQNPMGFNWNISANIAAEKTEIVTTSIVDANGNPADDKGNKWFVGQSIKVNYDYVFDGIIQTGEKWAPDTNAKPGSIKVKDLNGDGKIDQNDRKVIGSQLPTWYGGATNTLKFMGFELSTFFVARRGVQRLNDEMNRGMTGRNNFVKVNYWTPENPSNTYARPHANNENPQYLTSMLFEDASYIALKNMTLSYNVPEGFLAKSKVIGSLRLYLQATNLKYWTKYKSYNPESGFMAYPMIKSFGFGINAGI
jgi:TonB-linked SusC/RagA family outer membrane protein